MPPALPDTLRLDSAAPTTASVYRVVRGDAIEPSRIRRTPTGGAIIAGCGLYFLLPHLAGT